MLTYQERQVVLFLIIVALIGTGINFISKRYSQIKIITSLNEDIGKVNINKADKVTLIGIPGIGERLASRIIDYRDKNNGFKDIEELKEIKGINRNRYQALKEYLYLE